MPISDSDFSAWLSRDDVTRTILCEAKYWDGTAEQTLYMSNTGYVTKPSDTPANTPYREFIKAIPNYSTSISVPTASSFSVKSSTSFGDIKIENCDKLKDEWLNYAWAGRRVSIFLGDKSWARSDFKLMINGFIDSFEASDEKTLTLKIRGLEYQLDVPISNNLLTTGNDKDKPKPLSFGNIYNASPVLIDSALQKYMVHDGNIDNVIAKDNGAVLTITQTGDGTFTLTTGGTSNLTTDIQGYKPAGASYITTAVDIVKYIFTTYTGLTSGDLDTASFDTLNALCPQIAGIYTRNGAKVVDVANELLASIGAFYTRSIAGKIVLKRFDVPTNSPVLYLNSDTDMAKTFKIEQILPPLYRVSVGYNRNYSVLQTVAGALAVDVKAKLQQEWRVATATNLTTLTAYPLASVTDQYGTCLQIEADAATEASRLLALHGVQRIVYSIDASISAFNLQLGDTINLKANRYGFDNGKNCVVVGIDYQLSKNKVKLKLWA